MKRESIQSKTFGFDLSAFGRTSGRRTSGITSLLVLALVLFVFPVLIAAQSVSGVTGVVTDPTGAVVPGVDVKLTDTKTSRELTTKTNDDGVYTFNNVPPGTGYQLSFTITGFQTTVLNEVSLGIGRTETQNAQLTAGDVSGTVTVTTTTGDATLNTTDASVGNVIGERQLRELPIQFRSDPAALIGLQPGAIGTNVGTGATGGNRTGSVTGSRTDQGNITVDGIDANDQSSGQAFSTIANAPIDSVQEFRAVTANPSASEGRSSGGQIQLATKGGTNDFHGNLRIYNRTATTAANSFFNNRTGVERPQLTRNQYGGSLGGPLPMFNFGEGDGPLFNSGKDKLFFFFDYEGRRDAQGVTYNRVVPLQSFREGRIGYINDAAGCAASSRANTTPQCISYLTPAQVQALDPQGIGVNQAFLSFLNSRYPLPNDLTAGDGINTGGFRFNAPTSRKDYTYTTRIDANVTNSQKMFARYTDGERVATDTANSVAQQFPGDVGGPLIIDTSYAYVVGHSWTISPSLFNQATFGVTKAILGFPNTNAPSFPNEFAFGMGLSAPFAGLDQQFRQVTVPTIRNDLSYTRGSHSLQFGGIYKPIASNSRVINDLNFPTINGTSLTPDLRPTNIGSGTSTTEATTITDAFDAAFGVALGRYSQVNTNYSYDAQGQAQIPGSGKITNWVYNEYELYAQDNWRIRNDLTITLGVRWHYYSPPYEKNGIQAASNVDFQELLATRLANGAAGIGGVAAEPITSFDLIGKGNNARPIYEGDKNNFGPRISVAYNPSFEGGIMGAIFGNRRTVLRAGASKVYDRVGGGISFLVDQLSFIFDNSASTAFGGLTPKDRLLTNPRFTSISSLPVQNVAPVITRPFAPNVVNGVPVGLANSNFNYQVDKNFEIPYSYTYSVGFQRELPGNLLLDVNYVGRLGRKLFAQGDLAQVIDFKDPASGQFMLEAFNAVQAQLLGGTTGANVTRQPWLENQINLAFGGGVCTATFNCTSFMAQNFDDLFRTGGSADLVQQLYFNKFIRPNVGMSAQFASNAYVTNLGHSKYDGLLVSLQKRFSRGVEFDLNYSFSKSKDNQSNIVNTVNGGVLCDVTNIDACYGPSDFDIRHLFNANFIAELPFGRGRAFGTNMNRFVNAFVGGWTLSGIVGARSGYPINATSGSYSRNYFVSTPAILVGDASALKVRVHDDGTGIQLFDDPAAALAALRFPRHGETGSRNTLRSPIFATLDLALSKKFRMPWSEGHTLTLRGEAYNATNSNFFNSPNATNLSIRATTFGRITTSQTTPREFQFALRYDF